jgi:hypothetical protein
MTAATTGDGATDAGDNTGETWQTPENISVGSDSCGDTPHPIVVHRHRC